MLAAALPVLSKDKLSYTIQLRKGVQFNDGTPFNAQAVVTTIQRYMTYPGSAAASDYAAVDSVTASGPYTVVFHLKARDSTFIAATRTSSRRRSWPSSATTSATNPVCVGPFMFDHRVVGDHVTLIKSPYYYDQKNVYLDKIVYKPMPDAAAAAAALKAGDIQVLDQVSTTELAGVRQSSSLRVIQAPQLGWRGIIINIGNKNGVGNLPYTNVGTPLASSAKLRQAFEEAIDRNDAEQGRLRRPRRSQLHPDPAGEHRLVRRDEGPVHALRPQAREEARRRVGLPEPDRAPADAEHDRRPPAGAVHPGAGGGGRDQRRDRHRRRRDGRRRGATQRELRRVRSPARSGRPRPRRATSTGSSRPRGDANYSGYSNPRLDLILANGLKATSIKARSTLYRVAQQIIPDDRPIIVLYNPNLHAAVSSEPHRGAS